MKLLAFLIPFFLLSLSVSSSNNSQKRKEQCEKWNPSNITNPSIFKWKELDANKEGTAESLFNKDSDKYRDTDTFHLCYGSTEPFVCKSKYKGVYKSSKDNGHMCFIPLSKLVKEGSHNAVQIREKLIGYKTRCDLERNSTKIKVDFLLDETKISDVNDDDYVLRNFEKKFEQVCINPEREQCIAQGEKDGISYWDYENGRYDCYTRDGKGCKELKNPTKDCSPERRETMTDVFIQGLGFVSASSGNTCIALAIQSFPQTKAYSSAVKKCTKQKKEACKSVNGKPQCKSCDDYKKQLEHVNAESVKMLAGYKQAVDCAQQTKTDYKGSAEECNVINAFNRDKCCFMPEHMNTPLCDDFGSEHAFSPNLGYTDKKRIGGGESIDYGGDELPFVHSPSKFDPKKDPILNSPLSPDSGSSIGGGGGAGGSPYTNSDSALGLSRKGAFQTYIQGGGGSRLGKSSSKNKSYPYALSSFERKKLKYKNKNNKKGKATIRSLASKRNRTIFEKISDVYTSLINKRKLFFKGDGAQK